MKKYLYLFPMIFLVQQSFAQSNDLPIFSTSEEHFLTNENLSLKFGITNPPSTKPRSMAEWEELQAVNITWRNGDSNNNKKILSEIVKAASKECEVWLTCEDSTNVKTYFQNINTPVPSNVRYHIYKTNSIWSRDYGANSIYLNDVDTLAFVDWVYNRQSRTADDLQPNSLAAFAKTPLYTTTSGLNGMVHTGGNFMSDGLGSAFSSDLVVDENVGNTGAIQTTPKSENDIKNILKSYMGIKNYALMEILPYDVIHHIDMHMKLLDEETILVGEFPKDVADGPQIEANIAYITKNFKTAWGTDYKIRRVPMPKEKSGGYNGLTSGATYQTYANALICNKTVILPVYGQPAEDTVGINVWKKTMPGYTIYPINCASIITSLGAIHCISKEMGVADPLWITYKKIDNVLVNTVASYPLTAQIKHKSGVKNATLFYTLDLNKGYTGIAMKNIKLDDWYAEIPVQNDGSQVFYYVEAEAKSGKKISKPMVAPKGYYTFSIAQMVANDDISALQMKPIFPNPASAMTCIPVTSSTVENVRIDLVDMYGRVLTNIANENLQIGENQFFIDVSKYASGVYFVTFQTPNQRFSQRLIVR